MNTCKVGALVAFLLIGNAVEGTATVYLTPKPNAVFSNDLKRFARIFPRMYGDVTNPQSKIESFVERPDGTFVRVAAFRAPQSMSGGAQALSNDGWLVLLENSGDAIRIFSPQGELVRSYGLKQLYDAARYQSLTRSAGGTFWLCSSLPAYVGGPAFFGVARPNVLYVYDSIGGIFRFTLPTADFRYEVSPHACPPR